MTPDNLPEHSRGRPAAQRPAGGGVERAPATPPPPPAAHQASQLGWVASPDRFHWWSEIHDDVKAYLERKVGRPIEWWADLHERDRDRPYAVVLGPNGLAVTTPRVNTQGQRTQSVRIDPFVPSSLEQTVVQQKPTRPRGGLRSLASRGRDLRSEPPLALQLELTEYMRGILGNLPLEAQQRLQTPFLGAQAIKHYQSYYYGSDEKLDLWCYLAGDQTVSFAAGHRTLPRGADPQQATWRLTLYQADVAS